MEISGKKDSNYSFFYREVADSFIHIKDSCRSYLLNGGSENVI